MTSGSLFGVSTNCENENNYNKLPMKKQKSSKKLKILASSPRRAAIENLGKRLKDCEWVVNNSVEESIKKQQELLNCFDTNNLNEAQVTKFDEVLEKMIKTFKNDFDQMKTYMQEQEEKFKKKLLE